MAPSLLSRSNGLRRSPRQQRGAVAIYAVGALVSGFGAAALAVDIGQLYYAQRDLQKMASDAALDAARAQSGCYTAAGVPGSLASATAAVDAALDRDIPYTLADGTGARPSRDALKQGYGLGVTGTVEYGMVGSAADNNGITVRAFTPLADTSPAVDSVRVNLARQSPALLVPFITAAGTAASTDTILLRASAAAQQSPVVSYRIGNQIASLSLPLICGLVASTPGAGPVPSQQASACAKINVGSPADLANASVTLAGLSAALGIDDPGKLLTTNLPEKVVLQGLADALAATGQSAAATVVGQIAAFADPSKTVIPGDALGIESMADNQISMLPLNAVELLNSLALAANAAYPIVLPVSIGGPNLPGVSGNVFLTLGDTSSGLSTSDRDSSQKNAAGRSGFDQNGVPRTSAKMEQLKLLVRLNISTSQIPALSAVPNTGIKLGIDVTAASASTFLSSIRCPAPVSGSFQPSVAINATISDATVKLGGYNNQTDPINDLPSDLVAVGGKLLTVTASAPTVQVVGGSSGDRTFTGPFNDPPGANSTMTFGTIDLQTAPIVAGLLTSLGNNLSVKLTSPVTLPSLPGIGPVGPINPNSVSIPASLVIGPLQAPLQTVITTAVDPILAALGTGLNGTTVTVLSYQPGTNAALVPTSVPVLFTRAKPGIEIGAAPVVTPYSVLRNH